VSLSQQSRDSLENLPNVFEAASMCHRHEAFLPRGRALEHAYLQRARATNSRRTDGTDNRFSNVTSPSLPALKGCETECVTSDP
jgi:hypothetical protein